MVKKNATSSTKKTATTNCSTSKKVTTGASKIATKKAASSSSKIAAKNIVKKTTNSYSANGVTVNPANYSAGDKIKITYNGLLSECGATEVFAHIGWGESWTNINDVKMSKTKSGFTATVTAYESYPLNVCFKDIGDNWDNNNGYNYTIYPHSK